MHIMPKYVMFYTVLYSIYNQCVSQCEMGRIAVRNGPFRSAVRLWSFCGGDVEEYARSEKYVALVGVCRKI